MITEDMEDDDLGELFADMNLDEEAQARFKARRAQLVVVGESSCRCRFLVGALSYSPH